MLNLQEHSHQVSLNLSGIAIKGRAFSIHTLSKFTSNELDIYIGNENLVYAKIEFLVVPQSMADTQMTKLNSEYIKIKEYSN